jgi:hypothetical protein
MALSARDLALGAAGSVVAAVVLQVMRIAPIGSVLAFAIYFIIWWVSLFVVLPFGVHTHLGRVAALTTMLASAAFAVVLLALRLKIVPLE